MQKQLLTFFLFICFNSFSQEKKFEVHGHRGFRGKFPENTLTAFKEAAKAGADYIELDVIISADSQVVVSHEPWFNPTTCTSPEGKAISKRTKNNLHRLTYSEIKKYDCGARGNAKFPEQAKMAEYKPLLSEVIETMEKYCKENNLPPIKYNIEIKNNSLGDRKYHFDVETTVRLTYNVIKKFNIDERILIQCFDKRSLKEMHRLAPQLKTGLLVANLKSLNRNIRKLSFTPNYYLPVNKLCRTKTIRQAHKKGCKIIVWTVNSEKEMQKWKDKGVDGIITDYPNVAVSVK